jgi:hypothetical protein
MENKPILAEILFWGMLAAFVIFIGGYVFTLTSTIAATL